jgi:tetratricopeptide (TPR) repeat protein
MALSGHYYWIGMVALDSGDANNALFNVEEASKLAQINKEKHLEASAMILLGRILGKLQSPKSSKAEANIRQGIEMLEQLKLRPFYSQGYLYLGELYADMGYKDKALETLRKVHQVFQEMGMDYWMNRTQRLLKKTQESTNL